MGLIERKITTWTKPISSLADRPQMSAAELKAAFDSNANELKPALNGLIDDLTGPTGAGEIGTSPIEGVTGTDVQTMLEFLKGLIDLRDPATDVDRKLALKADTATVAAMVKSVAFNAQTGVFTITEQGGTVHEIDTVLEKVPVSCRLDGQDFVLTLEDGTEQRASLGAFLTPQEFANSDTVQFEVAGNTIRAKIKSGSINADMLTGTILEELTAFRDAAARSAQNAAASEQNAAAYKTAAAGSAQEAGEKAAESGGQAANARSWAAGGTGTRAGEDTDNAKYYRDQAMLSATQAGENAGAASADAARAEAAARGMGVHIGADLPGNSEKIWLKPVDDPLIMNPNRATADMTQEVAVDDDGRLVTKPTTMQGTLPPPTTGDAGKVPVVNADGDGYELTAMAAGGAAETWVKIGEYTWTAEDAAAASVPRIIFTEDANGSPISCDKILITGWAYTESNRILYGLFGENLQIVNANYLLDAGDILRNDKGFIAQVSLFEDPVPHAESQFAVLPYINGGNSAGSKLWTPSTESRFEYPIKKITLFPNAQILEGSTFEVWGRSVNV